MAVRKRKILRKTLPLLILILGIGVTWQLLANSPRAKRQNIAVLSPMVNVQTIDAQSLSIPLYSQGTVLARTQIDLSTEVSGRIIKVSPNYERGGFFRQGEILLSIDPRDYRLAMTRAEAKVASAKQQLAKAEAEYKQKLQEYRDVASSKVSDFALRRPQFEEAKASLKAANAELEQARLQLERCQLRAPFDGRISEKKADLGQFVNQGSVAAHIYSVDVAEIPLPVSPQQAQLIDLPRYGNDSATQAFILGEYGELRYTWHATIERTDASFNDANRLLYLIAQVDDPYAIKPENKGRPPLAMGMFVKAEIPSRPLDDVAIIPREAVHDQDIIWLLDESLRLRQHKAKVIYRGQDQVYIDARPYTGQKLIISQLDAAVDGMQLRLGTLNGDKQSNRQPTEPLNPDTISPGPVSPQAPREMSVPADAQATGAPRP